MSLILSTVHISCSGDFGAHFICMFSAYYSLFMKKYSNCYIFNIYCRWSCEVLQNLTAFSDSKILVLANSRAKLAIIINKQKNVGPNIYSFILWGQIASPDQISYRVFWWLPVLIRFVAEYGLVVASSDHISYRVFWWLPVLIRLVTECSGGCQSSTD